MPLTDPRTPELDRMIHLVQENSLVRALLTWADGFALILDEHNRVLAFSDVQLRKGPVSDPQRLLGLKPGDGVECVYEEKGPEGCGSGVSCNHCGLRDIVDRSRRAGDPVEGEYKLTTEVDGGELTAKYRLRASSFDIDGHQCTIVLFQDSGSAPRPSAPGEEPPDLDWPEGLDGITKVRKIGVGGMGAVFLVKDDRDEYFALKTVRARLEDDLSSRERFRRERDISLRLDHPNVLKTLKAELTESGHMYMICEYCPGGSVYQQLQRLGHVPVDLGLYWMIGAARGLNYLWEEHGIIHRDLKPDNLLVGDERQIKISDFGLARPPGVRLRVTAVGTIFGSPEYMSPEQMRDDRDMDIRSDLYALGATFRELLSEPPTKNWALDPESEELLPSGLPAGFPVREDVPEALAAVLRSLTAPCKEDRPPTPAALVRSLESIAADLGIDPDSDPEKGRDSRATVRVEGKKGEGGG